MKLRWLVKEEIEFVPSHSPDGQILYGGKSVAVAREVRMLQYWDDDPEWSCWRDVPEAAEENET